MARPYAAGAAAGSVAEVAAIAKLANETKTAIVPQGGNTGLVGGQIPHHGEIILSLNRLDKVREVDPVSNTMTVEAGVTLARAREAAANADRLYPQLLPSEGTCTIGGNLSTNAGGVAAIAHGIARSHALGLEVVLADGRVLNDLNELKKNNTGYDLKQPFHRRRRHAWHHHRRSIAAVKIMRTWLFSGNLVSGNYSNSNVSHLPTYTGNVNASFYTGNGSLLTGIIAGTTYFKY